jgi:hypothetical protein
VSTLWTPGGEHEPGQETERGPTPGTPEWGPGEQGPTAEQLEEMIRARAELAAVPVADIVANHAVGLWQLALLHLLPDPEDEGLDPEPRLPEAALAIDAFAALVEGLGERLAPHDEALREALAQLRLAYVQVQSGGAGS